MEKNILKPERRFKCMSENRLHNHTHVHMLFTPARTHAHSRWRGRDGKECRKCLDILIACLINKKSLLYLFVSFTNCKA